MEEGKESQLKDPENIFHKIIKEKNLTHERDAYKGIRSIQNTK